MAITPKNWGSFQHYKNRAPPWIKLHHALLDNIEFHFLPVASRALAPCLWLLASEHKEGRITLSVRAIAFRLHCSETEIIEGLKPLIDEGFFIDDSNTLAGCYQSATPEERRGEAEKREKAPLFESGGAFSQEPLPSALEGKGNGSARSFASASNGDALAREPSTVPPSPDGRSPSLQRPPAEFGSRQGMSPDLGNDYRSPPRTKSDNVLEPIPDRPDLGTGRRKRTY